MKHFLLLTVHYSLFFFPVADENKTELQNYDDTAVNEAITSEAERATEAGKAYFEQDGTISVYGWGGED